MTELIILVTGYAHKTGKGRFAASPATVLLRDSGKTVLVDPGCNPDLLRAAMARHGVTAADIDLIFLTHYHLDHLLNLSHFPGTAVADGWEIYSGDEYVAYRERLPGTGIRVLTTPGHAVEHASLVVSTDQGRCAIAGDVFWWDDGQERKLDADSLLALPDRYALDLAALRESRLKLLHEADYIIPGHGEPFPAPKS